jgi:hypothetical protein
MEERSRFLTRQSAAVRKDKKKGEVGRRGEKRSRSLTPFANGANGFGMTNRGEKQIPHTPKCGGSE